MFTSIHLKQYLVRFHLKHLLRLNIYALFSNSEKREKIFDNIERYTLLYKSVYFSMHYNTECQIVTELIIIVQNLDAPYNMVTLKINI